jgi:hypothetical protein
VGDLPDYLLSPDPENWDFHEVTNDEVDECHHYEYGRESAAIRSRVESFRASWKGHTFRALYAFDNAHARVTGKPLPPWPGLYPFFPEFPREPYLSIDKTERLKRIALARSMIVQLKSGEESSISKDEFLKQVRFEVDLSGVIGRFGFRDVTEGCIDHFTGDVMTSETIAAFRFCWYLSDNEFRRLVQAWLDAHRPLKAKEMRGGASFKRLHSRLRDLSALRLSRLYGFWKLYEKTKDRNNKPLFPQQSKFTNARKRAKCFVAMLDKRFSKEIF